MTSTLQTRSAVSAPAKRTQTIGAVLLILAGLWYFISEAIAAAAWRSPSYSYISGFISDLGSSEVGTRFQGRLVNSPLHDVMNAAFIVHGALFVIAALLLFRMIPGRVKSTVLVFAILHGIGITMVGLFHESPAALLNGVIVLHSLGAATAIIGGNATVITIGVISSRRLGSPRWLGTAVTTIGALGIVSFIWLQILGTPPTVPVGGLAERGAVDTIMLGEILIAIGLLASLRKNRAEAAPGDTVSVST